jgi:phosphate-selective porin OprO/OprP
MKVGLIIAAVIAAADLASAQSPPAQRDDAPPVRFVWDDRPSIRAGVFRIDLRGRVQTDFRRAEQDLTDHGKTYETGLKRIGVSGRITDRVEFDVDRELRRQNPWRNVYVNVQLVPALEVRAGKFKMPFSYEELTGATQIDFVYRTLLAQIISPARDIGVMAHGRLFRRVLTYQAGMFKSDGENARLREPIFLLPGEEMPKAGRSVAGRLVVEPLRHISGPREPRRLFLGVAFTSSTVPEGLNSFRGQSVFGTEFAERMFVSGRRRRIGGEAIWMPGPFSVKSEYARAAEQRKRQGLLDDDISDFVSSAWYISGTWALTGEPKEEDIEPRKPLFQNGFGAVELALRYERIGFDSALKEGTPFVNPRADPLLENAETIWTLGVNWYLNKWSKVIVNGIREEFLDPERTVIPGRTSSWAAVLRLQVAM